MPMPPRAAAILDYWTNLGPEGWYVGGAALDAEILKKFLGDWNVAANGGAQSWQSSAEGMLAYLILTDQMPRNMFRDTAQAFATDPKALAVASRAWRHGTDLKIAEPLRQFFYMPLMHSESVFDQQRCVSLIASRMSKTGAGSTLHARAHREIIRRFGRFPFRNAALGRDSTADEVAFLTQGGYGEIVRSLGA